MLSVSLSLRNKCRAMAERSSKAKRISLTDGLSLIITRDELSTVCLLSLFLYIRTDFGMESTDAGRLPRLALAEKRLL